MSDLIRVPLSTGVTLDVLDVGPRDAPVLLFLHGFPESHRTWRHQIAHFAERYRCVAPDQRGYRGSSKPQEVDAYTPDKLIADVFALADALAIDRFTVVGHDWGGAIAWGVALMGQPRGVDGNAGRVRRAIIANAPHPALFPRLLANDAAQRTASQYIRAFRDPSTDGATRANGLGWLIARALRWEMPSQLEPEERDALIADWADPDAAIAMLNWYRASPIMVPTLDAPYREPAVPLSTYPKLTIPTLVIWAMADKALPPSNLEGLHLIVPKVRIIRVPDSGHFVPWEAPVEVNASMEAFLAVTGKPG